MSYCCFNHQKQLARDGVKGVIVSTENVKARPETMLIDANNTYVVMTYDTIHDALYGHAYWCWAVADALQNHNIIFNAWCEQITLKPRNESDPDYLESIALNADCY